MDSIEEFATLLGLSVVEVTDRVDGGRSLSRNEREQLKRQREEETAEALYTLWEDFNGEGTGED